MDKFVKIDTGSLKALAYVIKMAEDYIETVEGLEEAKGVEVGKVAIKAAKDFLKELKKIDGNLIGL